MPMGSRGSDWFPFRRRLALRWRPLALALLLTAAGAVVAQEPPPPAGDQPAKPAPAAKPVEEQKPPVVTEEITVTARKREETLQEVPFSVAAPTEEVLRSRGADNIEGIA